MNAYQLYDAVFDSARSEWVPESREDQIEDVIKYADSVYDIDVPRSVAELIVSAREAVLAANNESGEWTNNHFIHVESPLADIELQ